MSEEAAAPEANGGADPAPEGGNVATGADQASNAAAVEQAVADAKASGESLDLSRMVTVKVDGEEREVPLREAIQNYELRSASHKRFEQAAHEKKALSQKEQQLRELLEGLRDPRGFMAAAKRLGLSPKQIQEALEQEAAITPEQRREMELRERERRLQEQERRLQQEQQNRQLSIAAQREQARLSAEFNAALETHGLAGHPDAIAEMAQIMETALNAGHQLSAEDCAALALDSLRGNTTRALKGMSPAQLKKVLGEDTIKALLKDSLSELKSPRQAIQGNRPKAAPSAEGRKRVRISEVDGSFFDKR